MKEQLTDAQKGAIQAIGLSVEGIAKVEDARISERSGRPPSDGTSGEEMQ